MEFCCGSKISGWSGNFESSECIDVVKVEYYWQYCKVFSLSIFSNKNYQDFAIKNSGNCQKPRYKWHTVFDSFYSVYPFYNSATNLWLPWKPISTLIFSQHANNFRNVNILQRITHPRVFICLGIKHTICVRYNYYHLQKSHNLTPQFCF